MTSAATALDPAHPCRHWVAALYGRVATVGLSGSGSIVAINSKKSAVFVTCQHCFGTSGGLVVPGQRENPNVAVVGMPPTWIDGEIESRQSSGYDQEFRNAYAIFAPKAPKSAFDKKGSLSNIEPRHDFVISALSGRINRITGHLGMMPPRDIPPDPVRPRDPAALLGTGEHTAAPVVGALVLTLGYPKSMGRQLAFSVGPVLADDVAASVIARAEPGEAAIPYDPEIEFLVASQLSEGNSGGGVFDREGRFLGVMVRASVTPVDGAHFVRVVRASAIERAFEAALAAASESDRAAISPYIN